MSEPCRCGHTGEGPHPCHYANYSCGKPATQRFYGPRLIAIAGIQMKVEVSSTWACDECWEKFKILLARQDMAPKDPPQE